MTIRTIASTCRRSVRLLALISVGLTGGAFLSPATAHADPAPMCYRGPDENVYYKITNVESGESLNVSHRLQANGAPVIQWEYAGAANEQWRAVCVAPFSYKLVARHSGLVLDVAAGSTVDGAKVVQYRYHGGANQQWGIGRVGSAGALMTFEVSNKHSAKVLDVAEDGRGIQQSTASAGDPGRLWTFEQVGTV